MTVPVGPGTVPAAVLLILTALAAPAKAAGAASPPAKGLTQLAPAQAARATGEGIVLADGKMACLAGIEIAEIPALAAATDARLNEILARGPVSVWGLPKTGTDRWGCLTGQMVGADGEWIQAALLAQGLARVMARSEDAPALAGLRAAEAPARTAGTGLWVERRYRIRRASDAWRFTGSVQVVEGRVTSTGGGKSAIYLNLGEDRRHDASARLTPRLAKTLSDPALWVGRTIRIRGWLGGGWGPTMVVAHAGQIELSASETPAAEPAGDDGTTDEKAEE